MPGDERLNRDRVGPALFGVTAASDVLNVITATARHRSRSPDSCAGLLPVSERRSGDGLEAALYRWPCADRLEPPAEIGQLVEIDAETFVAGEPWEVRHIGDGVVIRQI